MSSHQHWVDSHDSKNLYFYDSMLSIQFEMGGRPNKKYRFRWSFTLIQILRWPSPDSAKKLDTVKKTDGRTEHSSPGKEKSCSYIQTIHFGGSMLIFMWPKHPFSKSSQKKVSKLLNTSGDADTSYTLHESRYGWTFFLLTLFLAKENKIWVMSGSSKEILLEVYDTMTMILTQVQRLPKKVWHQPSFLGRRGEGGNRENKGCRSCLDM